MVSTSLSSTWAGFCAIVRSASSGEPTAATSAPLFFSIPAIASRSSASRTQTSTRTPCSRGASAKASSAWGDSARAWGGAPAPSRAPVAATGKVTVKAAPLPVPGLATETLPPCISTR